MATATLSELLPGAKTDSFLDDSLEHLRWAVNQDVFGDTRTWAKRVDDALDRVERGLRKQITEVKDPDGEFGEVDQTRPTLDRKLDELRNDNAYLLEQVVAFREEVQHLAEPRESIVHYSVQSVTGRILDLILIRQETDHISEHHQQNQEAGTKLVQESMNTDIGGGD